MPILPILYREQAREKGQKCKGLSHLCEVSQMTETPQVKVQREGAAHLKASCSLGFYFLPLILQEEKD